MQALTLFLHSFSVWTVLIRLLAAAFIGGLIGLERGRHGRAAGLRTHILICTGAAITSLMSFYLKDMGNTGDMARMSAQVISGIGFLGTGTILVRKNSIITGLTTASGMWATAVIGIAIGCGFYSCALIASAICLFSVTFLSRLEHKQKDVSGIYVELTAIEDTEGVVNLILQSEEQLLSYDIMPPKSGHKGNVGISCVFGDEKDFEVLKKTVCDKFHVAMMVRDKKY